MSDDIPEHWWHANNDVSHLARIVTEQYQSLRSLIMANQADIDALTAELTTVATDLSTQVTTLGTDVTAVQTEITNLEAQVAAGTPLDLTALQSAAAKLATTQSSLDTSVGTVTALVPPATPPASGTGTTPPA